MELLVLCQVEKLIGEPLQQRALLGDDAGHTRQVVLKGYLRPVRRTQSVR